MPYGELLYLGIFGAFSFVCVLSRILVVRLFEFVSTLVLVAQCTFLHNLLMLNISCGCCRHSVSNTFVQLTEGRSVQDKPKQLPAKTNLSGSVDFGFFRLAKSFCVLGAFWPHEFEFLYAVHLFTLDSRTCFICDVIRAPILFYRHWSTLNGFQCALLLLFGSWRRFQPNSRLLLKD